MKKNNFNKIFCWLNALTIFFCLCACSSQETVAPVVDGWRQAAHTEGMHQVRPGETLYAVAFRYGLDYRELAKYNHIGPPYNIHPGQRLALVAHAKDIVAIKHSRVSPALKYQTVTLPKAKINKAVVINSKQAVKAEAFSEEPSPPKLSPIEIAIPTSSAHTGWIWPASGKVITGFSGTSGMSKGIDIAGKRGTPVKATAAGKVVYSGSGLRGYGELIIIKHSDEYLSAYAHNQKLLVKQGQLVKAGQAIAEMGNTETKQVLLHFEIRRAGKPVDPLNYLSQR